MSHSLGRSARRISALIRKESLQVVRDPSALLIAFVLPPCLLFMFAFAVSLDVKNVPIGLVSEGDGSYTNSLARAYYATQYLKPTSARHRRELEHELLTGRLKALVIIPQDFDATMLDPQRVTRLQIITDGSSPNTANFSAGYAQGVFQNWLAEQTAPAVDGPLPAIAAAMPPAAAIDLQPRFWFNPELDSRRVLVPGSIALVMTMIGTMLTALVVSREWERGTMEAIMSTPTRIPEQILSKLLPYFVLGIIATAGCAMLSSLALGVPMRGSLAALLLVSSAFLVAALGQGLLISTLARNQFVAIQLAIMTGFMPALLLSGFIFEIQSMPPVLQFITQVIPARYFVSALQTVFLAGDIWVELIIDVGAMLAVAALFFGITLLRSRRGLD
jgi:ABC-2 type transport system permease protein